MQSYAGFAALTFGGLYFFVTKDTSTLLLATGAGTGAMMLGMDNTARDKLMPVVGGSPQFFLPPVATAAALYYSGVSPMQSAIGGGISFAAVFSLLWISVIKSGSFV